MLNDAVLLRSQIADRWSIDPNVVFLNHGSFGAVPEAVREYRKLLLNELERQPMDFILRKYFSELPGVIKELESFLGAQQDSIVLVPNTTTGVNTVLSNLMFEPGDELLTTGQEYFSSCNALKVTAEKYGAKVIEIALPIPVTGKQEIIDAVMERVTGRTKLLLIDHITSPTGMILPVEELMKLFNEKGIDTLIDGAHGPGFVPINLTKLGATYYTGNCHKWLCSPKSCAVLHVRPDRQENFRPLIISHIDGDFDTDMSRFQQEFFWNGTIDPTPRLSIPFTLDYMSSLHPGGWSGIMNDNRSKIIRARNHICSKLRKPILFPDNMTGCMASIQLNWKDFPYPPTPDWSDPLQVRLREERQIEVPIIYTRTPKGRFLRISAQLYNGDAEYEYLADALSEASIEML